MKFILKKYKDSNLNYLNYLDLPMRTYEYNVKTLDDGILINYTYAETGDPKDKVEFLKKKILFTDFHFFRDDNGILLYFDGDKKLAIKNLGFKEGIKLSKEWKKTVEENKNINR